MNAPTGNSGTIDKKLESEIYNLIHYIDRLRKEIAGIAQEKNSQTRFEGMADRLDAIMGSTAEATDTILSAMESIDESVDKLRAHPEPKEVDALCDRISEKSGAAMEACSFQDLTGQRVTKVIGFLGFGTLLRLRHRVPVLTVFTTNLGPDYRYRRAGEASSNRAVWPAVFTA